jgi:AraC-like DNA-binding protein
MNMDNSTSKSQATSFNSLIDSTRRELAMHNIRETHRPPGEISCLPGFSEPGNCTRACKRRVGETAQDFRNDAAG